MVTGSVILKYIDPSAKTVRYFKTGGLSWQWSLKTDFTVLMIFSHKVKTLYFKKYMSIQWSFEIIVQMWNYMTCMMCIDISNSLHGTWKITRQ